MNVHLITGGARSGKSSYAEQLARDLAGDTPVTYIATANACDDEMRIRIEAHRRRRPPAWITIEASADAGSAVLEATTPVALLDCFTLLAANAFLAAAGAGFDAARAAVLAELRSLCDATTKRDGELIVVTNEVGFGIVPDNQLGRWFRDVLGEANCRIAERARHVTLVVAGCCVALKAPSGVSVHL